MDSRLRGNDALKRGSVSLYSSSVSPRMNALLPSPCGSLREARAPERKKPAQANLDGLLHFEAVAA